ncbi:hypothetical protein JXA40_03420 [bacterium]|nr:hypothetical protein [candidate division CSSED10-310 bacterium]
MRAGYQVSIWLYTGLVLAVITTLGAGLVFNLHQSVKVWTENEEIAFFNMGETMAMLLDVHLKTGIGYGEFSREQHEKLQDLLRKFKFDLNYRLYLVTRKSTHLIFPERMGETPLTQVSRGPAQWLESWQGILRVTTPYTALDGKRVKAFVQPMPPLERNPSYLVVLEKDLYFESSVIRLVRGMEWFLTIGLAFTAGILVLYAVTMIRPFRTLSRVVTWYHTPGAEPGVAGRDPVEAAIEMFKRTLSDLKEKERQLEEMNRLLEHETRQTEEFKENVLSSVDSGVMSFDRKSRLLSLTSKTVNMLRLREISPAGKTSDELFGPGSIISSMVTEALKTGTVHQNRQWKWELPGDPPRWLSLTSHLLKGDMDSIIGVGFIIRDITSWKHLEERVREKEHLAALGELSAGIAHEMRNPLGVIKGNAQLLSRDKLPEDQRDLVEDIQKEIQTLDRIIQDFLKFARPTELNMASVNLSGLVEDILNSYRADCSPRIAFSLNNLLTDDRVTLDEQLIRQVLVILLDNSVQSITGEGRIGIELAAVDPAALECDRQVRLSIQDTGSGIAALDFSNLFKPFFTTRPTGTGMGLAIARKLVVLHNGSIDFDPQASEGAKVTITLPARYDPDRTMDLKKR